MTLQLKADTLGIFASILCLIHCIATPFLFIAKACTSSCCTDAPIWWQFVDYLFIIISFVAIYYAVKNSTKKWVGLALWSSWALLLLTILSETFDTGVFPKSFVYIPAVAIVILHFYNIKYCKCMDDSCCANSIIQSKTDKPS